MIIKCPKCHAIVAAPDQPVVIARCPRCDVKLTVTVEVGVKES